MLKLLLEAGGSFDSVVCYNDQIAIQVIDTLKKRGLQVPEDVSVTGYDDSAIAGKEAPGLTTIAHPQERLGELAAELILEKIRKIPEEESKGERLIRPELIVRESVSDRRG